MSRLSVFPQIVADLFAQIVAESDQNLRLSASFYLRKSAGNGAEAIYFQPLIRMNHIPLFLAKNYFLKIPSAERTKTGIAFSTEQRSSLNFFTKKPN